MVDDVMARMGFGVNEPDSEERMRGLAHQLRGERDLGQLFQFSGSEDVRAAGQGMIEGFESSVSDIGQRRAQGLTRAAQKARDDEAKRRNQYTEGRNTAQDTIKAEALQHARKGYSDIENQTVDDVSAAWGVNNSTGAYEMIPGTEGMKTTKVGGKTVWPVDIPGSDEKAFWNSDTGKVTVPRLGSQEFDGLTDPMLRESLNIVAGGAGEIEGEKKLAAGWADELVGVASDMRNTSAAMSGSIQSLDEAVSAIDDGALTGKFYGYFPTLTNPTARFEAAIAGLTLEQLSTHKLTPVSDKDVDLLRSKAAPDMYPEEMKQWAQHKQESLRRVKESNDYIESQLRGLKAIPTGKEAERIETEADKIMRAGDFDFTFKRTHAGKPGESTSDLPPNAETITLSDGTVWNADGTPAQ